MKIKLSNGETLGVFITHIRPEMTYRDIMNSNIYVQQAAVYLGGQGMKESGTVAVITDQDGKEIATGCAKLASCDNFSKHKGVQVALGRALSTIVASKRDRELVWDQVFAGKYTRQREVANSNRKKKRKTRV